MRRSDPFAAVLLALLAWPMARPVWGKSYTMADLEALHRAESWRELLQRARDVSPAGRNERWSTITTDAALGLTAALNPEKRPWEALDFCAQSVRLYPHLKRSSAFMKRRGEAATRAFTACLRTPASATA